ncbi:deoxyguanosinetriphosphate triphosphohydrolase [candidate division KSB1 bacterium]
MKEPTGENNLAGYAASSAKSKGRKHKEEFSDNRLEFERDRDRIIHCAAFRRLEYKTQVFVNHEGDYYRTRLTHSIEVSQLSRSVARRLNLNEDLAEALALAHDLGHTPFGHSGEHTLNELMKEFGGFEHNLQSYRVVDKLEERYPDFKGLNLTWETREGILKHSSFFDKPLIEHFSEFLPGVVPTLEAQIINTTDEIAYNNHDIDDGLESDILTLTDLDKVEIWNRFRKDINREYANISGKIEKYLIIKKIISFLINDLVQNSRNLLQEHAIKTLEDVQKTNKILIHFSLHTSEMNRELKDFLYNNLYQHPKVEKMRTGAEQAIVFLFQAYKKDPSHLPKRFRERIKAKNRERVIADYIAGMTDRFALNAYEHLKRVE